MAFLRFEDFSADRWDALARACGSVWATREWYACRLSAGRDPNATFMPVRSHGELVGIVPLRSRWGIYQFSGSSDEMTPICAPEHQQVVADDIRTHLRWHTPVFIGQRMPADRGWARALGGTVVRRQRNFVAHNHGKHLASLSAKMRAEIKRKTRNAVNAGLRFTAFDGEDVERAFRTLWGLHAARWGEHSLANRPLDHDWMVATHRRGWLRLRFLEHEGTPIAAWQSFRFGDREFSGLVGRDPAWRRESIGLVLCAAAIQTAFDEGASEWRFGLGPGEYKRRFSTEDVGLEAVAVPFWGIGQAAVLALRANYRYRPYAP